MTTFARDILAKAANYPERVAHVYADGRAVKYGDLADHSEFNRLNSDTLAKSTSGTASGAPKVVNLSDVQFRARMSRFYLPSCGFHRASRFFMSVPMYTREAYVFDRGTALYMPGGNTNAADWLDMCAQNSVDGFFCFPKNTRAHLEAMIAAKHSHRFEYLFLSGAALNADDVARWQDKLGGARGTFVNYGSTETGTIAAGEFDPQRPGCVGTVHRDVLVRIEADGQIAICSPSAVAAYNGDDAMTEKVFRDEWVYLGDLGHFEGDNLVIDGRTAP